MKILENENHKEIINHKIYEKRKKVKEKEKEYEM
jgi:hypothetical protein